MPDTFQLSLSAFASQDQIDSFLDTIGAKYSRTIVEDGPRGLVLEIEAADLFTEEDRHLFAAALSQVGSPIVVPDTTDPARCDSALITLRPTRFHPAGRQIDDPRDLFDLLSQFAE